MLLPGVDTERANDEAALPLVLIDPINPVDQPLPNVGVSNWQGGLTAVALYRVGQAHGLMIDADGVLSGGADPRGDGMALGI